MDGVQIPSKYYKFQNYGLFPGHEFLLPTENFYGKIFTQIC